MLSHALCKSGQQTFCGQLVHELIPEGKIQEVWINELPYVELYFGTYEVYRVEISKQTYKGELNRFLFDRYICESFKECLSDSR